jgi:hypothetical protein
VDEIRCAWVATQSERVLYLDVYPLPGYRNEEARDSSFRASSCRSLQNLNILGLKALRALGHIELNGLTFLEAPEPIRLNRGEMHKDIFTGLPAYKAEPLGVVKPLHCSLFHYVVPVFLNFLLRRPVAA